MFRKEFGDVSEEAESISCDMVFIKMHASLKVISGKESLNLVATLLHTTLIVLEVLCHCLATEPHDPPYKPGEATRKEQSNDDGDEKAHSFNEIVHVQMRPVPRIHFCTAPLPRKPKTATATSYLSEQ